MAQQNEERIRTVVSRANWPTSTPAVLVAAVFACILAIVIYASIAGRRHNQTGAIVNELRRSTQIGQAR